MENELRKCQVSLETLLGCESCNFLTNNRTELATHMQALHEPHASEMLPGRDPKLTMCRVRLQKLLACVSCRFYTCSTLDLQTHMQAHHAAATGRVPMEIGASTDCQVTRAEGRKQHVPRKDLNGLPQNRTQHEEDSDVIVVCEVAIHKHGIKLEPLEKQVASLPNTEREKVTQVCCSDGAVCQEEDTDIEMCPIKVENMEHELVPAATNDVSGVPGLETPSVVPVVPENENGLGPESRLIKLELTRNAILELLSNAEQKGDTVEMKTEPISDTPSNLEEIEVSLENEQSVALEAVGVPTPPFEQLNMPSVKLELMIDENFPALEDNNAFEFCQVKMEPAEELSMEEPADLHLTPKIDLQQSCSQTHDEVQKSCKKLKCDHCGLCLTNKDFMAWHIENSHGLNPCIKVVKLHKKHHYQCMFCETVIFSRHSDILYDETMAENHGIIKYMPRLKLTSTYTQ